MRTTMPMSTRRSTSAGPLCPATDRSMPGRCAGECAAGLRCRNRSSRVLHAASKPAEPDAHAIIRDRWTLSGLPVSACSCKPNPVRRSVHQDLDRILHPLRCRAPSLLSNPPLLASSDSGHRAGISENAVCTYNLCSCGPDIPAIPKRVLPCNLAPGLARPAHI